MSIKKLNPYINFNGTAEQAIKLYESALGAQVEGGPISRFGDTPDMNFPPEYKSRVMHAMLRVGEGVIMISDSMPGHDVTPGSNVHVVLDFDDVADMTRKFDALAAGGKISQPLQDTFWGAKFGMLTDKFGINWMFNCELKK